MPRSAGILFVADESPFERERFPLSRELDYVISLLLEEGWSCSVATVRSRWDWHDQLRARGIPAYSLDTTAYAALPLASMRLAGIIGRETLSIIHALGPFCALISGLSRYLQRGPVRIYDRSHISGRTRLNIGSRVAARMNDHTLVRSEAVRDAARELDRTDPMNVSVALDGAFSPREASREEVQDLRDRLGIPEEASVIGMVARFRPEKGHLTLLEAMRLAAPQSSTPLHLVLVGAGPYEPAVRQELRPQEPFLPHLVGYQEDIAPWLALADVIVIPSYQDASPKTAAEALAAGCAVVASNVGGIPEQIIDGYTGLLVPPKQPEALAQALLELLSDPSRRHQLGSAGQAFYESKLTVEQRTHRWMECYDKIMSARLPG